MIDTRRDTINGILAIFCAGMLFAMSFVSTPAKFMALGVPIADLIAVGRVTFRASMCTESVFLFIMVCLARRGDQRVLFGCAAILATQYFALLPALNERSLAVMRGAVLSPSPLHPIWIAFDVFRLGLYLAYGVRLQGLFQGRRT